ncbi:unnamed protein product [Owenia fusiformis]|uniref:Uncharacterized protein n=1 Tax=Owenia fusiformis TaxID=6347 RepID=A0A8J1Y0B3_OWEFU|nr:unnamed protein product [Owenia fusiformis]
MKYITEGSNNITLDIDVADSKSIVGKLAACDNEIFTGWGDHGGLLDNIHIAETIDEIANKAIGFIFKDPETSLVVMSGCGTSGRLAFMAARSFNEKLRGAGITDCFRYIIAGKDKALFTSQEAYEDDPHHGIDALKEICAGKQNVLYIGITCGLSAPFVAGQLDYCMDNPNRFIPVLMGFNPIEMARDIPIRNWDKTFLDVARRLETLSKAGDGYILNPVVGPEPISGSSRMKSGTTTKILLETIFAQCFSKLILKQKCSSKSVLNCYETIRKATYKQSEKIGSIVAMSGEGLKHGGHIYYLGMGSLGIVGMIDASECPPTFGATLDDIRGFINNGFEAFGNEEGDITHMGRHFRISFRNFEQDISPNLSNKDTVIVLQTQDNQVPNLKTGNAKTILINYKDYTKPNNTQVSQPHDWPKASITLNMDLPWDECEELIGADLLSMCWMSLVEISSKWICNAISTGAHIMIGKIYQNIMIDVKVSNQKLYHRAISIIQKLVGSSETEAENALICSVFKCDDPSARLRDTTVEERIAIATPMDRVVPVALLKAALKCSIQDAEKLLDDNPVVRTAIENCLMK